MGPFSSLIDIVKQIEQEKKMAFLEKVQRELNAGKIIIVAADTSIKIKTVLAIYKHKDGNYVKTTLNKQTVVKYIQNKEFKFFTLNTEDQELTEVHVVDGKYEKYLRSDSNDTDEDNLGELPSVLFMTTIIDLKIQ